MGFLLHTEVLQMPSRLHTKILAEKCEGKRLLLRSRQDRRITLEWILILSAVGRVLRCELQHLAEDRDQWRALAKMVMKFRAT